MFSIYGVIIVAMILIGISIILLLVKNIFSTIKVNKSGVEFSKDRRCSDHPCDENKLYSIILQLRKLEHKLFRIPYEMFDEMIEYGKERLVEIEQKIMVLYQKTEEETNTVPTEKGYLFFATVLHEIMRKMEDMLEIDCKKFDYTNAKEDEFLEFREQKIIYIPEFVKNNLPLTHVLDSQFFNKLLSVFARDYNKDIVPIILQMIDKNRKIAKEKKCEKENLEKEYKDIINKYTKNGE
jgi:hypothetical protein